MDHDSTFTFDTTRRASENRSPRRRERRRPARNERPRREAGRRPRRADRVTDEVALPIAAPTSTGQDPRLAFAAGVGVVLLVGAGVLALRGTARRDAGTGWQRADAGAGSAPAAELATRDRDDLEAEDDRARVEARIDAPAARDASRFAASSPEPDLDRRPTIEMASESVTIEPVAAARVRRTFEPDAYDLSQRRSVLNRARRLLALERERRATLLARRAERVLARTAKSPVSIRIGGFETGAARVTAYDDDGIEIRSERVPEARFGWNQLPLESVYRIRRLALTAGDAEGWFELGRYLTLHDDLGRADRCFARAVAADPAFADRLPDTRRLRGLGDADLEEKARILRALELDLALSDLGDDLAWIRDLPAEHVPTGSTGTLIEEGVASLRAAFESPNPDALIIALARFAEASEAAPEHAAPDFYLALTFERIGMHARSLERFGQAIAKAPGLVEAHLGEARLLGRTFRYEAAREAVARAVAIQPDNARALLHRGRITFWMQRDASAFDDLELARVLAPKDLEIRQAIKDVRHVLSGPSFPPRDRRTLETPHYEIVSDLDGRALDTYARHLEATHALLADFFGDEGDATRRAQVIVFQTEEAYKTYAELTMNDRAEHSLGYFHPHYQQLLFFEAGGDREATLRVTRHEAFHHFVRHIVPNIPIWANEGMAEYFGASAVDESGRVRETGLIQVGRLANLRQAFELGFEGVAFADVMTMSQAEFYAQPLGPIHYAQAWSMVHFFFSRPDTEAALKSYIGELRDGASTEAAFEATFGQLDLDALQKDWRAHVDAL